MVHVLARCTPGPVASLGIFGILFALAVGCSVDEGGLGPNRPPETLLTYAGPVDSVNSHLRLRWWGEDADGSVTGYEYRWTFEGGAPEGWVFTTATTDSFALPAPAGAASHRFEVRAIDDAGAVDPSPAFQDYLVDNIPPTIDWFDAGLLPTVSLPALTLAFVVDDSQGVDSVVEVVAWLDGDDPDTQGKRVPASEGFVTLAPADFTRYGERTISLKAIDDALGESEPITHTLEIVEPVGNVIVFDDMPDDIAGGTTQTDPFYRAVMDEVMAGAPYTVHKIQQGPLRTTAEAAAIFDLFDVVIWYQGTNTVDQDGDPVAVSTASLRNAKQAIRDLLTRGGRMYLATMNAVGTGGAFDAGEARELLGVEAPIVNAESEQPDDTNFFLKTRYFTGQELWWLEGRGDDVYGDVRVVGTFWGMELFQAAPGADELYAIPPGIVFPDQERLTVATRVRGAGTMIYFGFPLSRCSFEQRHREVLAAILRDELGLPASGR